MFGIACGLRESGGWEICPSVFWQMSPREWWWLYDINVGERVKEEQDTKSRLKDIYRRSKAGEI